MTRRQLIVSILVSFFGVVFGIFTFKKYFVSKPNVKILGTFKYLIADIAEVIIPTTDTPGAKDAEVANYIIKVITNCASERDQGRFIYGLKSLEEYSLKNYSNSFVNCSQENKIAILSHFGEKYRFSYPLLNKIKDRLLGSSFFEIMKALTISGYCTSQLGVTRGLAYDPIPINYISCIPLSIGQKSWATK